MGMRQNFKMEEAGTFQPLETYASFHSRKHQSPVYLHPIILRYTIKGIHRKIKTYRSHDFMGLWTNYEKKKTK